MKQEASRRDRTNIEGLLVYSILLSPTWLKDVDFHDVTFETPLYAAVYQAYLEVKKNNETVSLLTLGKAMNIDAYSKLMELFDRLSEVYAGKLGQIVRAEDVQVAIDILIERGTSEATTREITEALHKLQSGVSLSEVAPQLAANLLDALPKGEDKDYKDEITGLFEQIQTNEKIRAQNPGGLIGISTGYPDLDHATEGIRPGQVWVVGGLSSAGKTTFSLNIVMSVLNQGIRTVMYSMEMQKRKVLLRLLSMQHRISTNKLEKGEYGAEQTKQYLDECERWPLRVVDTHTYQLSNIMADIIREHERNGTRLFVLDYIQHIETPEIDNEYRAMSLAIREMQKLATRLNVSIVVISQMSNSYFKDKQTGAIPLYKGSGNIFFVANVALEIECQLGGDALEELRQKDNAEIPKRIYCHKNRDGAIRNAYVMDNGESGRMRPVSFSEYEKILEDLDGEEDTEAVKHFNNYQTVHE